jgi:hypothetical protein
LRCKSASSVALLGAQTATPGSKRAAVCIHVIQQKTCKPGIIVDRLANTLGFRE